MDMNRRQFLMLAAAGLAAGCRSGDDGVAAGPRQSRVVNAGPAGNYAADGVYSGFRDQGFFLIRNGDKLIALSAVCTHRKCKLAAESDHSFYCKCHGSTFDPAGKVTLGPARRDLPHLPVFVDGQGQLFVTVGT